MGKKDHPSRVPGAGTSRARPKHVPAHAAKPDKDETDDDLENALEQTFPASDPIAFQSTLVPGRHR